MSGTSLDGVSTALVRLTDAPLNAELVAFHAESYSAAERGQILDAIARGNARDLALLHVALGERFAAAVLRLLDSARLMPDDSDETARVLWTAGSWLKYMDPETADIFYKALVRRNPHTILGAEADRKRWFPILDENGNIVRPTATLEKMTRYRPENSLEAADTEALSNESEEDNTNTLTRESNQGSQEAPEEGYRYLVQAGDTLKDIAKAYTSAGVPTSVAEIRKANQLATTRLQVGQVLFIPAQTEPASEPALDPPEQNSEPR